MDYLVLGIKWVLVLIACLKIHNLNIRSGIALLAAAVFLTGFEWSFPDDGSWANLLSYSLDDIVRCVIGGLLLVVMLAVGGAWISPDITRLMESVSHHRHGEPEQSKVERNI